MASIRSDRGRGRQQAASSARWLLALALAVIGLRPLHAHTFPGITVDGLFVSDTVVLVLDIRPLEMIAILDGESLSGQQSLTRAQIEAGMPAVRAYLERTVLLRVDGAAVRGQCLGLNIALDAFPADQVVEKRLPFIMTWAPPR